MVILTTTSTNGKLARDFAADFYDYGPYGIGETKDGLIFLIDMGGRNYYTVTTGNTISVLNDDRIEKMNAQIENELMNGWYKAAVFTLFSNVTSYLKKGPVKGDRYNPETGQSERHKYISIFKVLISLLTGSLGFMWFWFKEISEKQLKKPTYHYPFYDLSDVTITKSNSIKTSDFVTERRIERSSNDSSDRGGGSSGGSTTFTGSSGTSHGGGGGKF